ncbi:MAG: translation elongation factor Ts [Bdellovibrionales bacterium]|nr:translation elongation factor Ts [Bdellovibrionales bacterium]
MSNITASLVKELREKSGAGMMDCKSALQEVGGDLEKAIEVLRKKGLKDVGKRAGKVAAEGTIGTYVHAGSQVAAMVELNCETDFVARGEEFQNIARDIAMHVAALRPSYVSVEDIPQQVIAKEEEIMLESLNEAQRAKADKILPGKMKKFYEDSVLLAQAFVKDDSKSIQQLIDELSAKVGEKVSVRRIACMQVGEGVEKKKENLAEEVAATIGG